MVTDSVYLIEMFKRIRKWIRSLRPKTPLALLEEKFIELKDTNLRNAAEHAYALAMIYKQKGDSKKAIDYGREAVALFDRSKLRTEWDTTRKFEVIEGIAIPNPIHQAIVREHLKPLSLALPPKEEIID